MELCDRLRRARRRAGMSQAQLASRIGVHRSAVAQWESTHGTVPSVRHLLEVAGVTGAGMEWLALGRGSPAWEQAEPAETADAAVPLDELESRVLELARRLPTGRRHLVAEFLELMLLR